MLNRIEQGAKWRDALHHSRSAFLAKDPDDAADPLAYRLLLIMPLVWRQYGSYRLNDMKPWIKTWQTHHMFAGSPGSAPRMPGGLPGYSLSTRRSNILNSQEVVGC